MSQFTFLKSEFAEVHGLAVQAEGFSVSDPRAACVYARLALETIVNWLYRHETTLKNPYETTLSARLHDLVGTTGVLRDPAITHTRGFLGAISPADDVAVTSEFGVGTKSVETSLDAADKSVCATSALSGDNRRRAFCRVS